MPTTTPPSTPSPVDPAPQPTRAPPPAHMPTVPARIAPASTGWNDEGEPACIRRENSRLRALLCNTAIPVGYTLAPPARASSGRDETKRPVAAFHVVVEAVAELQAPSRDWAA